MKGMVDMSYCPKCGKEMTEVDNFCGSCGYRIKTEDAPVTSDATTDSIGAKEKILATIAHIGLPLLNLHFFVAGLFIPIALYNICKKKMPFAAKHAFQAMTWGFLTCAVTAVCVMLSNERIVIVMAISFFINGSLLLFALYPTYKVWKEKEYTYPLLDLSVGMTKKKTIAVGLCTAIIVGCFAHIMIVTERQANKVRETAKDVINNIKKEYEERQDYAYQHGGGTQSTPTTKETAGKNEPYNFRLSIGDSVYLGGHNVEMAVTIVEIDRSERIISKIGKEKMSRKGVFQLVKVYIENISKGTDGRVVGKFVLMDDNGRQYSHDHSATLDAQMVLNMENVKILEPQEGEYMIYVFDIPSNVNIDKLLYKPSFDGSTVIEIPFGVKIE